MSKNRPHWLSEDDSIFFEDLVSRIQNNTRLNISFKEKEQEKDRRGNSLYSRVVHKNDEGSVMKVDPEKPIMKNVDSNPGVAEDIYPFIQSRRIPHKRVNYLIELAETDSEKYKNELAEFNDFLQSLFDNFDSDNDVSANAGGGDFITQIDPVDNKTSNEKDNVEDDKPTYGGDSSKDNKTRERTNNVENSKIESFLNGNNHSQVRRGINMTIPKKIDTQGLEGKLDKAITAIESLNDVKSGEQLAEILNNAGINNKKVTSLFDQKPELGASLYQNAINSALTNEFKKADDGDVDAKLSTNSLNDLKYSNFANLLFTYGIKDNTDIPLIGDIKFTLKARNEFQKNKRFSEETIEKLWEAYKIGEPDAKMDLAVFAAYIHNTEAGQLLLGLFESAVQNSYETEVKTTSGTTLKTNLFKYVAKSVAGTLKDKEGISDPAFADRLKDSYKPIK